MKDQRALGPARPFVCEAVAAVPATGGAVAALLAVRVGVVVAAVLDVSRAVNTPPPRDITSLTTVAIHSFNTTVSFSNT